VWCIVVAVVMVRVSDIVFERVNLIDEGKFLL